MNTNRPPAHPDGIGSVSGTITPLHLSILRILRDNERPFVTFTELRGHLVARGEVPEGMRWPRTEISNLVIRGLVAMNPWMASRGSSWTCTPYGVQVLAELEAAQS